jgi:endo-1,4-beta-xylanase
MRTAPRRRLSIVLLVTALSATTVAAALLRSASPVTAAEPPVTVISADFEDGTTQGWAARGADEAVTNSTAVAHGGTHSLVVTGRAKEWQAPILDVLDTMELGTQYTISVWMRLASGAGSAEARLSVERRSGETASYDQVVGNTAVSETDWTNLKGTYTLANDVDFLTVYVETSAGTASFHIDDFLMSYVGFSPVQTDLPALKDVFAADFPIGTAVSRPQLLGEQAELLTHHFNAITPGNAMKWDATERTENSFTYTDADAMVEFAKIHQLKVRGHTLVWHQQTPAWVFSDASGTALTPTAASKELVLSRLENHIRNVAGRWKDDIYAWDVVNEVVDEEQSDGLRRSDWYNLTGLDYIRTAFRVAREVAPAAKLYINDYSTTGSSKRDKLYNLVKQLKSEGVPVDGVGHQMHGNIDWPSAADTEAAIKKFAGLGVEQQVTEMDISVYTNNNDSLATIPPELLIRQAARYKALFEVFRRNASSLTAVILWGLADNDTWLKTWPKSRLDLPLLFDEQLQAKPAYWSVVATAGVTGGPSQNVPGSCQVSYRLTSQWQGGFQSDVKITNTGDTGIYVSWALSWDFTDGQTVSQGWNASFSQSGTKVTATSDSWNGDLPVGGSVAFGFVGKPGGASNSAPTAFALNGTACSIA